jgi:hypothetical protein
MKSGLLHFLQVVAVANSIQPLTTLLGTISFGVGVAESLFGGQVLVAEIVKVGLQVTHVQPPS